MQITVAIPTYNRPQVLAEALDSLLRQERLPDEVVVVDSSPQFQQLNNPGLPSFIHVRASEPNLPHQRWEAVERASGDVIAFLDDDILPAPDYLARIAAVFEADSAGIIGAAGGWMNHAGATGPARPSLRRRLAGVESLEPSVIGRGGLLRTYSEQPSATLLDVPTISGGAMAYRTDVLRQIGPLPWLYELYRYKHGRGEDGILSSLVRHAGYRVVLCPSACVLHRVEPPVAYANAGHPRGVAETWGRYVLNRVILPEWRFADHVAFWRYVAVNVASTFARARNFGHLRGALAGAKWCYTAPRVFLQSIAHAKRLSGAAIHSQSNANR